MNKTTSRALALIMAAGLALSGCGAETKPGDSSSQGGSDASAQSGTASKNEIKELVIPRNATRELETFNFLYTQRAEDFENLTNLYDGLLEADPKGKLVPCIAESWGTEDNGLTWTFHLRDGVKWVDVNGKEKADCLAQDFATGMEWILNFHKNDSNNISMPIEMIKGAKEYYEYTKSLSPEEAKALNAGDGSKFREMVGVATPDDHTVVYTCVTEKPYFDTLASYCCLYPFPQGMIDELGVDNVNAMNNENMWYNGCYTMTEYIQGNEKIFTKNPLYWDTESQRFDQVTIKMVESSDVAYQLYETGELDYVDLTESNVQTISKDPNHKYHDYMVESIMAKHSYQFHWNYAKNKEDGTPDVNWNTAIANEAFRKSMYYGVDLTEYYKRSNSINPLKTENNFYTMKGLVYTSDGTDYTDLVKERLQLGDYNGETMVRLDSAKAEEYKKQAREELEALGVTFPVEIDYYISSKSQTALDGANVLKNCFEQSLGKDYVQLNIKTFVSSVNKEVRDPRIQSFIGNGWGADYGDPQNFLGQEVMDSDNAWYAQAYSNINLVEETEATKELLAQYREFTDMVAKADAITDDMDARYNAYADAEAYLIEHCLVMPENYGQGFCLTRYNIHDKINGVYGVCNEKIKNWGTSADGYTTEEMEAALAAKTAK